RRPADPGRSAGCGGASPLALPLAQADVPVGRPAGKRLLRAVGPADVDAIDPLDTAQAEVRTRVVARQVTGAGVDPAPPLPLARLDGDLGTVGVALRRRVEGPHYQPVAA